MIIQLNPEFMQWAQQQAEYLCDQDEKVGLRQRADRYQLLADLLNIIAKRCEYGETVTFGVADGDPPMQITMNQPQEIERVAQQAADMSEAIDKLIRILRGNYDTEELEAGD